MTSPHAETVALLLISGKSPADAAEICTAKLNIPAADVPAVNEAERAHNRELFLHEGARNSSAASVEREERESRQRMKQRALFFERETQHKSRKGSGSVGHDDGQDRKTG